MILFCASFGLYAQDDVYYNSLNTGNAGFVTDLKGRIRSPYTRISYDLFDETNVANFASYLISGTTRGVICIYSGYEYTYTPPFTWAVYSREHTWCQSWMPYVTTGTDQYQDQHHLFPTHQNSANVIRSNHPLGNVTNATNTFYDAKYGTNSSGQSVYEPRSSQKGDAARTLLYMCVRYDGIGGYTWNFNWLNNTKLPALSEDPQDLNLLLQWHKEDPPEKWEVDRNNYIQSIQQNRNPFTDHPEYVNYINFNDLTKLSPSYSTEPENYLSNLTTTVTGNSITLNWTDAIASAQAPSGYIIEAYNRNNYFIPIDGSVYTDDINLDSVARVNVANSDANTYTFSGLNNNTTYYFRVYSYNGDGALRNYKITGTVPSSSATTSSVVLSTEPTNYVTNLSTSNITTSNITLNWTDALPGTQVPSGYLILANNSNVFSAPSDGTVYSDDAALSDGSAVMNIDYSAADNYSFTSLNQNTTYYFRVYSYNGTGSSRNYKTDGTVPNVSALTLTQISGTGGFILLDDFNRANNNSLGNTSSSSSSLPWNEAESSSGTGLSILSSQLKAGSTTAGRDAATVNLSNLNGYPTTFNMSVVNMQWAFNMRTNRSNPSGFESANYGMAFILGMTSSNYATSSGYAVVIGNSGTPDPIRLVYFSNGLDANTKVTNIISGSSESGSDFLSVRVKYVPSTNEWTLYTESNATAFPQTNPRLTSTQIGNVVTNSTFSGSALSHLGVLWNHNTSATDLAYFDDIYITDPVGALTVQLSSFTSSVNNRSAKLNWVTESENNNLGFDVERAEVRSQNLEFCKTGSISGKGTVNTPTNYSFEDRNLQTGKYKYRLKQIDNNGNFEYFALNGEVDIGVPKKFDLSQNYPNPFNPMTKINFDLPTDIKVTMIVYDITGREIARLVNNEYKKAGYYTTDFNAGMMSSGVYFYSLSADNFRMTKKMVVSK